MEVGSLSSDDKTFGKRPLYLNYMYMKLAVRRYQFTELIGNSNSGNRSLIVFSIPLKQPGTGRPGPRLNIRKNVFS